MIESLLREFQKYIKPDTRCVLALSGGPDSMMARRLYDQLSQHHGYRTDHLHIVHAHHHIRQESDQEAILVQQRTNTYPQHIIHYTGGSSDENSLRKRRKREIIRIAKEIEASHIITGHNLTDRIETTLMNMLRGCQLTGLVNMQHISTAHQLIRYKPLLDYAKINIVKECNNNNIPYVLDLSNNNISLSKRNQIRHTILQSLVDMSHSTERLRDSWKTLYHHLEEQVSLNTPHHHLETSIDETTIKVERTNNRSDKDSVRLLQQLAIYYDLSQAYIRQLTHVCTTTNKQIHTHGRTISTTRTHIICIKVSNSSL